MSSLNLTPDFFDISIVHKTYKFYVLLHEMVGKFPKRERHSIGQDCEQTALQLLRLMFRANDQHGRQRLALLHEIDTELKMLKMFVRLAFDVKAVSDRQYLDLQASLQEIGKMLGGWIKQTQTETSAR